MKLIQSITFYLLLIIVIGLGVLPPNQVQATVDHSDKTIVVHYARYDDQTNWSAWLWSFEPVSKAGSNYTFSESDSFGQVVRIPLADTQFEDATRIGIIIRNENWMKDIPVDRYVDLTFDENNELHIYLVQATEEIFTSEEDASAELSKYHIDGDYHYKLENGQASLSRATTPRTSLGSIIIPATTTIDGQSYNVTSIGDYAFTGQYFINDVSFPSSITSIGKQAFMGTAIKVLSLPSSITRVEAEAFRNSINLHKIFVPQSLSTIESSGFLNIFPQATFFAEVSAKPAGWTSSMAASTVQYQYNHSGVFKEVEQSGLRFLLHGSTASLLGNAGNRSGDYQLTIPNSVTDNEETYDVVTIAFRAFSSDYNMTSVTIPTNITRIESYAFSFNNKLTSMTFNAESNLKRLQEYSLYGLSQLRELVLPYGLESLERNAMGSFYNIDYLFIPSSVVNVESNALNLGMNTFPLLVIETEDQTNDWSVDWNPFDIKVYYGQKPPVIKSDRFEYVIANDEAHLFGIVNNEYLSESATIPSSVTSGISYPVTSILGGAFRGGWYIRQLTIPSSVNEIAPQTFIQLYNVSTIEIDEDNPSYTVQSGIVFNKNLDTIIYYPRALTASSYEVPSEVIRINDYAFYNNQRLRTVSFEENSNLRTIGDSAFASSRLRWLNLPDGVVELEARAFNYVQGMFSLYVPSSVLTVGKDALNIQTMTSILYQGSAIPNSWDTNIIGTLSYNQTTEFEPIIDNNVIYGVIQNEATVIGYFTSPTSLTSLVFPETITVDGVSVPVTSISNMAFRSENNISEVVFSSNIERIGAQSFWFNNGLRTITFAEDGHLTEIGYYAFAYVNNVIEINIPSGVTTIESNAFTNMNGLRSVYIPSSVSFVGFYAFSTSNEYSMIIGIETEEQVLGWNADWNPTDQEVYYGENTVRIVEQNGMRFWLQEDEASLLSYSSTSVPNPLVIPSSITIEGVSYSVTSIQSSIFNNVFGVRRLELPSTIESILPGAFAGAYNLEHIDVDEDNPYYKDLDGVLYNSSGTVLLSFPARKEVSVYNMPNSVETIERYAFSRNQTVRSIEFSNLSSLTTIKSYAFSNSRLNYLVLPSGLTTIENYAFDWVQGLSILSIPASVDSMGQYIISSSNKVTVYVALSQVEVEASWPSTWTNNTNITIEYDHSGEIDVVTQTNLRFIIIDGEAYLNGYYEYPSDETNLIIPNTVGGNNTPVVEIMPSAFQDVHLIRSVQIPENVKVIGSNAFGGVHALHILEFAPNSRLERIESHAFFNAYQLKEIDFPSQLEFIGSYAFAYIGKLSTVSIPASVTNVERAAFRTWENDNRVATIIIATEEQTDSWSTEWNPQNFEVFYGDTITLFEDDVFKYWIIDQEATITGFKAGVSATTPDFPESILVDGETIPVTTIGASSFSNNEQITSVIIPSSIKKVASRAFEQSYNIERLRFEDNTQIESIEAHAFRNTQLTSLTIPNTLKTIGYEAFAGIWTLATIDFEENSTLHTLGEKAFAWNGRITSMSLPASLEVIQPAGVGFMENLVSISIPSSNQYYKTVDGVLFTKDGTVLITYPSKHPDKVYTVPASVERIESEAFSRTHHIEFVQFEAGSNLTSIGDNAFNWSSIRTISLPDGLESIEFYAFYGSRRMSYISVPNSVTNVGHYAFGGSPLQVYTSLSAIPQSWNPEWKDDSVVLNLNQTVELHSESDMDFLITDGEATFLGVTSNYSSTSLSIPESITDENIPVTTIGNSALFNNKDITEITIPTSVLQIQDQAFRQMTSLDEVTFTSESQLQHIGRDAFSNTSLIEFRIPDSVESIGQYAFAWNQRLSMVYIPLNVESIDYDAFSGGNEQMLILVENDQKPAGWHQNWMGWNNKAVLWDMEYELIVIDNIRYAITREQEAKVVGVSSNHPEHVIVPPTITVNTETYPVVGVLNGAFADNLNITEVTLHSGVRIIHDRAFFRALNLASVNLPSSGLITIGSEAFQETRIEDFALPSTVETIGDYAFSFMYQLQTMTIPEDSALQSLGDGAFQWSSNIKRIYIPEHVSGLTINPLRGVHQLEEIDVSENNTALFTQSGILFERHGDLLHIVAYANRSNYQTLIVPSNVSVIGQDAIRDAWMLEKIEFEPGSQLVELKSHAIIGTNIKSIRFPSSLTTIGEYGLAWNWNLQSVYIDSGVVSVGRDAFIDGNQGMEIFIKEPSQVITWNPSWNPNSKTVIYGDIIEVEVGMFTFRLSEDDIILVGAADGVTYPNSLEIPSTIMVDGESRNVTVIGTSVLGPTSNVQSLIIPHTVKRINAGAFKDAYRLQSVKFDQSSGVSVLERIGSAAFRNVGIETIEIPASVIRIDDEAFAASYRLRNITFEENALLQKIGSHAFSWNWNLTSISVPSEVNEISPRAFSGNNNLTSINVDSNNDYYSSSSGVLFNNTGSRLLTYPAGKMDATYEIPSSVVVIEDSAFNGTRYLQSLTFEGTNLTTIGAQAFSNSSIRTLTLPDGLIHIEHHAFSWNENLVIVSIPDSVVSMGYDLFNGTNENLIIFVEAETLPSTWGDYWNRTERTIVLNSYVQTHSENDLEYIISNDTAMLFGPSIGTSNASIIIPSGVTYNAETIPVTSIASAAFDRNQYLSSLTIPGSIRSIGSNAFSNNYQLTTVTFSEDSGLVVIGKRAFENTSISSLIIPKSVTQIDDFAFANNYALQTLNLSSGVHLQRIGQFAFAWTGINSLVIPSGVTVIDDYAFHNSYNLTDISFVEDSQLQTIGRSSFAWSYNLTSFEIPENVVRIKESAFRGNSSLQEFVVDEANTQYSSVDGVLFNKNQTRLIAYPPAKNQSSYVVPNTVTIIESDAFTNAYNLQDITLSTALTTIRRNAFSYTSLAAVTLPDTVTHIEEYAFFGNWSLRDVFIPDSVTHVGFHAFRYMNHNAVLRVQADSIPSTWNSQWNPSRIFTVFGNEVIEIIDDFVYSISFEGVVTLISPSETGSGKTTLSIPSHIKDENIPVTKIGDGAFMNSPLQTITIPNTVTSIGNSAFKNTFELSGVIFADNSELELIEAEAFANTSLPSILIPSGVLMIEEKAFENAYQLSEILFASGSQLTTIKAHAFAWNPVITSYDLPNSLEVVAENAFLSNTSLEEININNAFYTSSGGVLFNQEMSVLIHYPSAKADLNYEVPASVTRIAPFAFRDSQFNSIDLPQGLETIGDYAFFGNSGLSSLTIPSTVTFMGNEVINSSNSSLNSINNLAIANVDLWDENWNTK